MIESLLLYYNVEILVETIFSHMVHRFNLEACRGGLFIGIQDLYE